MKHSRDLVGLTFRMNSEHYYLSSDFYPNDRAIKHTFPIKINRKVFRTVIKAHQDTEESLADVIKVNHLKYERCSRVHCSEKFHGIGGMAVAEWNRLSHLFSL